MCKFVAYTSKYELSIYAVIEKEFKYLVKVLDTENSEEYTYGMYGSLIDEGISCVSGSDYDNNVYATISFDEMTEKQDIIAHFYFDIDKYEDKIVFREYPDEELQKRDL